MARHQVSIEVQSRFGVKIPNTFYYHDPAVSKLMILLPGRGYTVEAPALYYTRQMALELGFDVLGLQYGFTMTGGDFSEQTAPYLKEDVAAAVGQVIARSPYQQVCVVAKSLGTLLVAETIEATKLANVAVILLTPLPGSQQEVGDYPTLAIIGSADQLYTPDMLSTSKPNIRWKVLDGANHGFEVKGEWGASIDTLRSVVAECELFLTQQT